MTATSGIYQVLLPVTSSRLTRYAKARQMVVGCFLLGNTLQLDAVESLLLPPVWPDWAICESSWEQICLQSSPKTLVTFRAILKSITLCQNCCGIYLGNFWKHLGNIFTPLSGHTGRHRDKHRFVNETILLSWPSKILLTKVKKS